MGKKEGRVGPVGGASLVVFISSLIPVSMVTVPPPSTPSSCPLPKGCVREHAETSGGSGVPPEVGPGGAGGDGDQWDLQWPEGTAAGLPPGEDQHGGGHSQVGLCRASCGVLWLH